jgi:DNA polymerase/3'-5' exonuclease PolX
MHHNCLQNMMKMCMLKVEADMTHISKTVRYTATLPLNYIDELKELAREKKIPSVNFAINKALDEYLKDQKAAQYEILMKEAAQDKKFLTRTISCAEDFCAVDGEVSGKW